MDAVSDLDFGVLGGIVESCNRRFARVKGAVEAEGACGCCSSGIVGGNGCSSVEGGS